MTDLERKGRIYELEQMFPGLTEDYTEISKIDFEGTTLVTCLYETEEIYEDTDYDWEEEPYTTVVHNVEKHYFTISEKLLSEYKILKSHDSKPDLRIWKILYTSGTGRNTLEDIINDCYEYCEEPFAKYRFSKMVKSCIDYLTDANNKLVNILSNEKIAEKKKSKLLKSLKSNALGSQMKLKLLHGDDNIAEENLWDYLDKLPELKKLLKN